MLITSGFWGEDPTVARSNIERLRDAHAARGEPTDLQIRLSVDEFHERRVGLSTIRNIIEILREPEQRQIGVFLRSIQTEASRATIRDLAQLLGGSVTGPPGSERIITGDLEIGILYKPLILQGGARQGYTGAFDRLDPASAPRHPGLETMESGRQGIKGNIDIGGIVSTVGSTSPANLGSVYTDTYESFQRRLFGDIISRALFDEGFTYFIDIVKEIAPGVSRRSIESNDMYLYFHDEMRPVEKRLYTTLRLAQEYERSGKIEAARLPASIRSILGLSRNELEALYQATVTTEHQHLKAS